MAILLNSAGDTVPQGWWLAKSIKHKTMYTSNAETRLHNLWLLYVIRYSTGKLRVWKYIPYNRKVRYDISTYEVYHIT